MRKHTWNVLLNGKKLLLGGKIIVFMLRYAKTFQQIHRQLNSLKKNQILDLSLSYIFSPKIDMA